MNASLSLKILFIFAAIGFAASGVHAGDRDGKKEMKRIAKLINDTKWKHGCKVEAARDKVRYGKERKSMVLKQKEREMVAYHEAGHTLIHLQTTQMPPLYKVSIIPRGQALGATTLLPDEDQNLMNKQFLLEELLVLMGGRAAEKVFYGCTTNGASGDLDVARKVACKMIHEWGMGERLYYEPEQRDAEVEINRLLEEADKQAHEMILAHKDHTEQLAQALLARETLTREEVLELLHWPAPEGQQTVVA